jgi:hypothetical protein
MRLNVCALVGTNTVLPIDLAGQRESEVRVGELP